MHADGSDAGEDELEDLYEVLETDFLGWGAGVGRVAVFVLSSFVADAYAVFVVAFAVVSWLGEEVVLCEGAVALYVEVIWDVFVVNVLWFGLTLRRG